MAFCCPGFGKIVYSYRIWEYSCRYFLLPMYFDSHARGYLLAFAIYTYTNFLLYEFINKSSGSKDTAIFYTHQTHFFCVLFAQQIH